MKKLVMALILALALPLHAETSEGGSGGASEDPPVQVSEGTQTEEVQEKKQDAKKRTGKKRKGKRKAKGQTDPMRDDAAGAGSNP